MTEIKNKKDFLYPELSYQIIGIAYAIYNQIGFGHLEKTYCNAFEEYLKHTSLKYTREFYYPVKIFDKIVAKNFFDFLVENKVILEIKIGTEGYREVCSQAFKYLKSSDYKLVIIIRFTKNGVKIKRIPKFY